MGSGGQVQGELMREWKVEVILRAKLEELMLGTTRNQTQLKNNILQKVAFDLLRVTSLIYYIVPCQFDLNVLSIEVHEEV